jgi:hypothetical protein
LNVQQNIKSLIVDVGIKYLLMKVQREVRKEEND